MSDAEDLAKTIKDEWERRARSPDREFFVASHQGWNTEDGREKQARNDARNFLLLLDLGKTAGQDILEIGCGSGRLVPYIAPHFRTYTGFDISPTMIEVARKRCASVENARFFESDGVSIPKGACDRQYDVAVAAAVLIHCPKDICETLVDAAMKQIRVGGRLRLQMYADPSDPEGIASGKDLGVWDESGTPNRAAMIEEGATADQRQLIAGTHYDGHRFRYAEAKEWLSRLGDARLFRVTPLHLYADVIRKG
jgi:SAM-dependent methyltransferase